MGEVDSGRGGIDAALDDNNFISWSFGAGKFCDVRLRRDHDIISKVVDQPKTESLCKPIKNAGDESRERRTVRIV